MKCKNCGEDSDNAMFCCGSCRVAHSQKTPSTEPAPLSPMKEPAKPEATRDRSSITGDADSDAKIRNAIASTQLGRERIPLDEIRPRLSRIKSYNGYQLSIGQRHHCTTVWRLAEVLTLWGVDAIAWLKSEAKGVGFVPSYEKLELP